MQLQMIDAQQVRASLGMRDCIEVMAVAMKAVTLGSIAVPPRILMPLIDSSGILAVMPGSASEPFVYGAKIVSLHAKNPLQGRPAIQGFVVLFDHETGTPTALVDGAEITSLRTAAASALATRLLARESARTLGILGCGVQAASHLEAICSVREIAEVRVWGRSFSKAQAFTEEHSGTVSARLCPVGSAREAADCDIVCAVTNAHQPILEGQWLRPGCHVNLVGAHSPVTREADTALIVCASVFVDSMKGALEEAGDLLIPIHEGAIGRSHIKGELGELLLGRIRGRCNDQEITVYKSLGLVAQDLLAAHAVFAKTRVPL